MRHLLFRGRLKVLGATLVSMSVCACASLLGIEEAVCDPNLDRTCDPNLAPLPPSDAAADAGLGPQTPEALHARLCDEYCELITEGCTGVPNGQYMTIESCQDVCVELMQSEALFAADAAFETTNTVECRLRAARGAVTAGEVASNCQAASMLGGDQCGEPCEVYCNMMEIACNEQFSEFADCEQACEGVPRGTVPFQTEVPPGNTLECRVYHIKLATSTNEPRTHCPHAAGLDVCR